MTRSRERTSCTPVSEPPFQVTLRVEPAPSDAVEAKEIFRGFVDGPNGRPVGVTLVAQRPIPPEDTCAIIPQPQLAVVIDDQRVVIDLTELVDRVAEELFRTNSQPARILKLRPRY